MSVWDRNGVGWREIGREGRGWEKELRGRRMTEEGVERESEMEERWEGKRSEKACIGELLFLFFILFC